MGWVLLNNGTRQKVRLRPGTATVGRAQNADIRPNHQSVSRLHAEIVVELLSFDVPEAKSCPIFLIDNSSTGHTFVNTRPTAGKGVRMPLKDGDTLAFGVDPVNFSLQWVPTVLSCSSRMTPEVIENMKALSRKAGAFLIPEWTQECTHLITERLSITPKLLHCVLSGGAPVAASFLQALAENDNAAPMPDHMEHQPQPPIGADAAYAVELEACVCTPKSKKDFLHGVYVTCTNTVVHNSLSKALIYAGVRAQFLCGSLQDLAVTKENLTKLRHDFGPLAEMWVAPTLDDELADALVEPLVAAGVQRCLVVPIEAIVRGMLLGSREAVYTAANHLPLGRGTVQAADVNPSDVKIPGGVKDESFPQTQEHSVVPPSLRASASEAPPTLTRKRDESGADVGMAKRQCTNGMLEAAKESHSQEQKPAQSLAVGMAPTVSSFTRTKSEKAALEAPFTVGSESGVKKDGEKLKVEAVTRPAATLSSGGGPTPSVEGSGMPKILSINFDTPFTQPKPEDEKEEIANDAPKEEIKLKSEMPAPQSLGVVSSGITMARSETRDGITMARSETSPVAPQEEYVPKTHPVEAWLPKLSKNSQKQTPLIVNVQGLGEIDIRVLRAGISKAPADPVISSRRGIGVVPDARDGRTSNGRRNFKLFRKSVGQQVQSDREVVPVANWVPPKPTEQGLAEAFASHRLESESQLPPVNF